MKARNKKIAKAVLKTLAKACYEILIGYILLPKEQICQLKIF